MQKIVIAGGSGFLGKLLLHFWKDKQVVVLTRNKKYSDSEKHCYWDGKNLGDWVSELENTDLLLNLSGKSVNCRYNEKNKTQILNSRIDSTKVLGQAILQLKNPPKVWLNSSSATIYRHALDKEMTEKNGELGTGFSVEICKAWENVFFNQETTLTRKVALRTSIVMGKGENGVFDVLKELVKNGLGGRQGLGNQYISWIHAEDFKRAIEFIYSHENLQGPINVCAPNPITNTDFMRMLREALGKKFGLNLAPWMVKLGAFLRQTEAELVLKSRRVFPEKLIEAGFTFNYPKPLEMIQNLSSKQQ